MAREISRSEGIFVGYTSGAAMQAVKQLDDKVNLMKISNVVVDFSRSWFKIYE